MCRLMFCECRGTGDTRRPTSCGCGSVVEHHLAKVRVAGSNPVIRSETSTGSPVRVVHGGVAERRGSGLQSRTHGFESRLHLAAAPLWAIGAAVARFPDTEEVTGSIPVSPTARRPPPRGWPSSSPRASAGRPRASAGSRRARRAAPGLVLEFRASVDYLCGAPRGPGDRIAMACGCGSVVEHHLAKVRVAGSNPVIRSDENP